MKKYILFAAVIVFAGLVPLSMSAQVIITVAGVGTEGYTGDSGLAVQCRIHWPQAIALDTAGNKYIADANNNVIRKIKKGGDTIITIAGDGFEAGTGMGGYGGDGAPATAARFSFPSGVAVDLAGNIYIADQNNHRVRKIDPTGIITTVAGVGGVGYTGDGGPAVAATLYKPTRVSLDAAGNIYIADAGNNAIRKVDIASGTISTIAGSGTAGFSGDGGPAITAQLHNPVDMAVDLAGNVYICDNVNYRIRKVDVSGTISTYAGIGLPGYSGDSAAATAANIYEPSGIAVDSAGNVYFSDLANARVRRISALGIITTVAGNGTPGYLGDGGPAKLAEVYFPQGLALTPNGKGIYIADMGNDRIRYVSATLGITNVNSSYSAMNAHPNPSSGQFTVSISSAVNEPVKLALMNVTGQKIREWDITTNTSLSVEESLAPGVYILSAITANEVTNEKMVIR